MKKRLFKMIALPTIGIMITGVLPFRAEAAVPKPALKWAYGGAYGDWCEDGWYSSPAAADLNGDGKIEIIASAYSIVNLDGTTGKLTYRIGSGHDIVDGGSYEGRTWPDIIIKDIDGDGKLEFITAHNKGFVSVYDASGMFKPGWPQRPTQREIRSLKVEDLDGDGKCEIIAGLAVESGENIYVYNYDGKIRQGWPQLEKKKDGAVSGKNVTPVTESSYAWGIYNNNISVGNLNGDAKLEIIAPSDVHYICAYDDKGNLLPTNSLYEGRKWGKIGLWESMAMESGMENEGWGYDITSSDPRDRKYHVNMAHGASIITDLDGDGQKEVVVTGNMVDYTESPNVWSKYTSLHILNADRTRFIKNDWNWSASPITGPPLSEDLGVIEACQPNPVAEDIDGDGKKEILLPAYDGKLHCFWLDKTEKHSWPFNAYNKESGVFEYASSPAVVDLDGDGKKEIIFTTWTQKSSKQVGSLCILNYMGEVLHKVPLPESRGEDIPNGGLAKPLIADIDGDGKLEIVVNTIYAGVCAYELK